MRVGIDYRPALVAPQSGIGRQVIALEEAFLARPDTVLERFSAGPMDHPYRQSGDCHFPPWPSPLDGLHRPKQRLLFESRFLPQTLRRERIDLYVATANMGLPLLSPRPRGMRYVQLLHDLFQLTLSNYHASPLKKLAYRWIDRFSIQHSLRVADRIWTPSSYTAEEVRRHFPFCAEKLRVLPNLVLPFAGEPAPLDGKHLPPRFWLAVGTREPRKNIPWFVDAWRGTRAENENIPALVLVGDSGDLPPEQRTLPGLHVLGGLSDAELFVLYRTAERLWQPSYAEGFGLPVIEALGAGTPVAVARGSALDEIVPPAAPRFDPRDGAALSRLMRDLCRMTATTGAESNGEESPERCRAWAARYGEAAYRTRLYELVEDACR